MERGTALPATAELTARIDWLIRLRWLAAAGVFTTVTAVRFLLDISFPAGWLYAVTLGLLTYNAIFYVVAKRIRSLDAERVALAASAFANVQISVDFLSLAVLLHFSGGLGNPFAFYFIFHVIIASILLSRRATYLQATWGLFLLTAIGVGEYVGVMRHYPLWSAWRLEPARDPTFVAAQLFVLASTLYLSAYMATGITTRLRERERSIVDLSEEISRNAEALRRAYSQLREVERMKSQYMRKVSHELRSPLSTIQSALKVVLDGLAGDLSERSRDMVSRAERRARELISVTQDLLVLSRARDVKREEQMQMVSVAEVAASICEEMRPAAEEKGVSLSLEIEKGSPQLLADPEEMTQLVGNLVGNAVKYTPPGGSVSVSVRPENGGVRLEVQDTGIGIPPGDQPKIFEEFYRAENARQHAAEGTGLGLSIVKAIADAHGAQLVMQSEVGKGTRFTVIFPPGGARTQNA